MKKLKKKTSFVKIYKTYIHIKTFLFFFIFIINFIFIKY